jgi:hypothetical protein
MTNPMDALHGYLNKLDNWNSVKPIVSSLRDLPTHRRWNTRSSAANCKFDIDRSRRHAHPDARWDSQWSCDRCVFRHTPAIGGGGTAPHRSLADRICPKLLVLGPAVLVGMSTDYPSTSLVPRALHEATIALDFASVTKRIVKFSDLPIRDLLLHRGRDYVQSAPPNWIAVLVNADVNAGGSLIQTVRAIADADMNVQKGCATPQQTSEYGLYAD